MTDPAGRYRLTMQFGDRPPVTGWWQLLATAERKWTAWVGEQGRDGVRIVLVDTGTGEELKSWP